MKIKSYKITKSGKIIKSFGQTVSFSNLHTPKGLKLIFEAQVGGPLCPGGATVQYFSRENGT